MEPVCMAHGGEIVCVECMNDDERTVFEDRPGAQELMEQDGYLSVCFEDDIDEEECCSRCGRNILAVWGR